MKQGILQQWSPCGAQEIRDRSQKVEDFIKSCGKIREMYGSRKLHL